MSILIQIISPKKEKYNIHLQICRTPRAFTRSAELWLPNCYFAHDSPPCPYRKPYTARTPLKSTTFKNRKLRPQRVRPLTMLHCVETCHRINSSETRFRPPTRLNLETHAQYKRKPRSMPVHDGSRSDQDERPGPPRPERSQRNPEQLVQGSPSMARSLRVQSQQLPTKSQVFEDEVLARTASAEHPAEEMSERHDHSKNLIGTIRIQLFAKSFILQVYDVLARHRPTLILTS